jgi:hypothetical protein
MGKEGWDGDGVGEGEECCGRDGCHGRWGECAWEGSSEEIRGDKRGFDEFYVIQGL